MEGNHLRVNNQEAIKKANMYPNYYSFVDQNYLNKRNLQTFISGTHLQRISVNPKGKLLIKINSKI